MIPCWCVSCRLLKNAAKYDRPAWASLWRAGPGEQAPSKATQFIMLMQFLFQRLVVQAGQQALFHPRLGSCLTTHSPKYFDVWSVQLVPEHSPRSCMIEKGRVVVDARSAYHQFSARTVVRYGCLELSSQLGHFRPNFGLTEWKRQLAHYFGRIGPFLVSYLYMSI